MPTLDAEGEDQTRGSLRSLDLSLVKRDIIFDLFGIKKNNSHLVPLLHIRLFNLRPRNVCRLQHLITVSNRGVNGAAALHTVCRGRSYSQTSFYPHIEEPVKLNNVQQQALHSALILHL